MFAARAGSALAGLALLSLVVTPPAAADLPGGGGARSGNNVRLTDRLGMPFGGRSVSGSLQLDAGLAAIAAEPVPIFGVSLSAMAADGQVRLTWQLLDGSDAAGFFVERSDAAAGPWARRTPEPLSSEARDWSEPLPESGAAWYRLGAIDRQGTLTLAGPIEVRSTPPVRWQVGAPFPNPARTAVALTVDLPEPSEVALQVFDISGRRLAEPFRDLRPAGRHLLTWDGSLDSGRAAAGIYFLRLTAGRHEEWRKVVVSR